MSSIEEVAAHALELADAGQWAELLQLNLPGGVVELIRRKTQLNLQITNLEEQERLLWALVLQLLRDAQQGAKQES